MKAIIVAGAGTVVDREDGSVVITGRDRVSFVLMPDIVDALRRLLSCDKEEEGDWC